MSSLDSILEAINGSRWLLSFALISGLFGIPLSIWLYLKGRRTTQLLYSIAQNTVLTNVGGQFDKLQVKYGDEDIPALSVARVRVWNAGTEVVDGSAITADALRLVPVDGARLLDVQVIWSSTPANAIEVQRLSQDQANVRFDYLDPRQGALLQVVHTGREKRTIRLLGTLKGAGAPKLLDDERRSTRLVKPVARVLSSKPFRFVWIGLGATFFVGLLWMFYSILREGDYSALIVIAWPIVFLFWWLLKKILDPSIPRTVAEADGGQSRLKRDV